MKRILCLCMVLGLCFGLTGCSSEEEPVGGSAVAQLNDYPEVKEKAGEIIEEIESAPSIQEVKTDIKFKEASSNTKGIIALHYTTSNNGEVILQFNTDSLKLNGVTAKMKKNDVEKSQDFIALVSAFSSIGEFNISSDAYKQIGEIAKDMKTTKVGTLTVSMKDIEGIYEFAIIAEV